MKKSNNSLGRGDSKKNGLPRWKFRFDDYRTDELAWLTFPSEADEYSALDLVWVGRLQGMPFELNPNGPSLVVPKESLPFFTKAGIHFVEKKAK